MQRLVKPATMASVSRIHPGKQPVRRHFLNEWLEAKGMKPMDLLDALNDPDRMSDLPIIDKSQVYRWLKGQLPQAAQQKRIAQAIGQEPEDLLRHPIDDWLAKFFSDRTREEAERAKKMLEAAFPPTLTGTDG